eukprot:g11619.t1
MAAFMPAVPLAPAELSRRSPRRSSGRWRAPPACAVQPQGERQEQGDDEDTPNLYRVTVAPTYEEMLAWAQETDERITNGRLPPLGSRQPPSGVSTAGAAGGSLLSEQEQAQMETLAGLLSKRRRDGGPLSEQEEDSLRAAMAGLSSSVNQVDDESFGGSSSSPDPAAGGVGEVAPDGAESEDLVRNQVYGSREVRDKVYLYAWSLMKTRQEKAKHEAEKRGDSGDGDGENT